MRRIRGEKSIIPSDVVKDEQGEVADEQYFLKMKNRVISELETRKAPPTKKQKTAKH